MGVFSDFSSWVSNEASAIGHGVSSFATGVVNTAKYGLKTVVNAPVAIVHEITGGVVKVSQVGVGAFTSAVHEGGAAFAAGEKTFVAVAHEASGAVQGLGKSASGAVGSLGSSFAWPLAIAAGLVGVAFVMKR